MKYIMLWCSKCDIRWDSKEYDECPVCEFEQLVLLNQTDLLESQEKVFNDVWDKILAEESEG